MMMVCADSVIPPGGSVLRCSIYTTPVVREK